MADGWDVRACVFTILFTYIGLDLCILVLFDESPLVHGEPHVASMHLYLGIAEGNCLAWLHLRNWRA